VSAITRDQLAARQRARERSTRRRRRRTLAGAGAVLAASVVIALLVGLAFRGGDGTSAAGGGAPPSPLDLGSRPPDLALARADAVVVKLPVDRTRIGGILFRAVDDPSVAALEPDSGRRYDVAPRDGRPGPDTGAVDVAAAPGTPVFAPVDGTIASVSDYVIAGRRIGYQVDIQPASAGDVVVRVNHIERIPASRRPASLCGASGGGPPRVGEWVAAGTSCLGQVRSLSDVEAVARPEIADYTSSGGSHVHIEVVRVGG
jgi:hypothetical protein